MKVSKLLFFIAMVVVLPICAMKHETDPQSDQAAEVVEAHVGFVVYTIMKARLDMADDWTSFDIEPLMRQIEELNSDEKYISPELYHCIQDCVKRVEADAGMKQISNARLPIKKVKGNLYDRWFDLNCLELRKELAYDALLVKIVEDWELEDEVF